MLSVSFSLVGGDAEALLSSGAAALLRLAAVNLTGVPTADARFSVVEVRVGNASTAVLQSGLSNAANDTAAASSAFAGAPLTLVSRTVLPPDSPDWNPPLDLTAVTGSRLRRLQSIGSCGSLPINSGAAYISTPVVTAQLSIAIPAAYLASIGALSPVAVAAVLASVTATFAANLNSPVPAAAALTATVNTWSSCTGLPPLLGVVASVVQEGSQVVIPSEASSGSVALPLILGLFGGVAVLALAAAAVLGSNAAVASDAPFPPSAWQSAGAGRLKLAAHASESESAALLRPQSGPTAQAQAQSAGGRASAEVLLLSSAQVRACVPE